MPLRASISETVHHPAGKERKIIYLFIYLFNNQSTSNNTVYKITQFKKDKTKVWIQWPTQGQVTSLMTCCYIWPLNREYIN